MIAFGISWESDNKHVLLCLNLKYCLKVLAHNGKSRMFQGNCLTSELCWILESVYQKEVCCCY